MKLGDKIKVTVPNKNIYGESSGKTYIGKVEKINRETISVSILIEKGTYRRVYIPISKA